MIIGITGHQSIPVSALPFIEREINALLSEHGDGTLIGISSLAAGADQLFARQVLRNSGQLQVVIPCQGYESAFTNTPPLNEYQVLLEQATSVETLPFDAPSESAFFAAGKRIVDQSDEMLAVWDGLPSKGQGGTADIVAYARQIGKRVRIIWPDNTLRSGVSMSDSIGLFMQAIKGLLRASQSIERPKLAPLVWQQLEYDKVYELWVMVSSPLTALQDLRSALHAWLDKLPNVAVDQFEFEGRRGETPHQTSTDMVERADVIVLLFGDEPGSPTGKSKQTFSKLEFDALRKRQAKPESLGRPRVYVYQYTERSLEPWEAEAASTYGFLKILDQQLLITQIFIDVSTALLAERHQQAKTLFELKAAVAENETNALVARERHAATLQQIDSSFKVEIATLTTLQKSMQERVDQIPKFEAASEARVTAAQEARARADDRSSKASIAGARRLLGAGIIGLCLGVLAVIVTLLTLPRAVVDGGAAASIVGPQIVSRLQTIADRISARPANVEAKIALAQLFNEQFDCALTDIADWPVNGVGGAHFSRAEVCEAWGSFVLRVSRDAKNCEVRILSTADADALARLLGAGRAFIQLARLIGRSSVDHVDNTCEGIPTEIWSDPNLQWADRRIHNNTQLGWARAAYARAQLAKSMQAAQVGVAAEFVVETSAGVLDRRSKAAGITEDRDRGVDIEILVAGPKDAKKAMVLR